MGIRVVVLTGNREEIANAVGKALQVDDVRSELSPEQKLEALDQLSKEGRRVAKCGDGINDAPASRGRISVSP